MIWRVRDRATFEALGRARARVAGPIRLRQVSTVAGPPRVAYSVGKSAGGAVDRNRIRRRLRAAVREHAELLEPGSAYLIGAGRGALSVSYPDLCGALVAALGIPGDRS